MRALIRSLTTGLACVTLTAVAGAGPARAATASKLFFG